MEKMYNCGMVVGRFSPIHLGHEKLINLALKKCKRVVVVVTYNDLKDENNPFDIEFKLYLIRKIYEKEIIENKLILLPFHDTRIIDNEYGNRLLKIVSEKLLSNVDYIVYGDDKDINKCFSSEVSAKFFKQKINRKELQISATKIRKLLQSDNDEELKKYINSILYSDILTMKKHLKRTFV